MRKKQMTGYQTPCSGSWSELQSLPSRWQRGRYVGDPGHFYAGVNNAIEKGPDHFAGSDSDHL